LGGLEDTSTLPDLAGTQFEHLSLFEDNFNLTTLSQQNFRSKIFRAALKKRLAPSFFAFRRVPIFIDQ
jgi:hypothetical protein